MKEYEYRSNNSGGGWWLSDQNWKDLEAAGWRVWWGGTNSEYTDRKYETWEEADDDRYLGALAVEAHKKFPAHFMAVMEFENITGQSYNDEGCECCGSPHSIY